MRELKFTFIVFVVAISIWGYFIWPRTMFTYNEPLKIVNETSTPGGMITWDVNVCRNYGGNFTAKRYLISVDSGNMYELPESSTTSTLKIHECADRQRSAIISVDIPVGEYGLMIKTTPSSNFYHFKDLEVRSENTIKIQEGVIK